MKISEAASNIIGVTLGEATLNLIRPDLSPIKAKYGLILKDGSVCGFMEIGHEWSPKTIEALHAFVEALENEALSRISEQPTASTTEAKPEARNEPPQF